MSSDVMVAAEGAVGGMVISYMCYKIYNSKCMMAFSHGRWSFAMKTGNVDEEVDFRHSNDDNSVIHEGQIEVKDDSELTAEDSV